MENKRLRVKRACDQCRLKKSKCNGDCPCDRCAESGVICSYGSESRQNFMSAEASYMQQNRWLTKSLKLLYEYVQTLPGSSIQNTGNGLQSVHNMVEHINTVLNEDGVTGGILHDVFGASSGISTSEYIPYNSTGSVMASDYLWPMVNTGQHEDVELQKLLGYGDAMYIDAGTKHSS